MPKENDMIQYETCLVLPKAYQKEAPKADNPAVYFEEKPERVILTRRVSGYFITDSAWEEEATSLKTFLKDTLGETDMDFTGYYRNGYDAPMRIFNRRNEVWYLKSGAAAEKAIQDYKNKITASEAEAAAAATNTVEEEKKVRPLKPPTAPREPGINRLHFFLLMLQVEATTVKAEEVTKAATTTAKPAQEVTKATANKPVTINKVTTKKPEEKKPIAAENRE